MPVDGYELRSVRLCLSDLLLSVVVVIIVIVVVVYLIPRRIYDPALSASEAVMTSGYVPRSIDPGPDSCPGESEEEPWAPPG